MIQVLSGDKSNIASDEKVKTTVHTEKNVLLRTQAS